MTSNFLTWIAEIQRTDLDSTTKHVLVALGLHGNKALVCWPSQQLIAIETGLTIGTVSRAVRKAETLGLLTIYKKPVQIGGKRVSNVYKLVAPHASHSCYRLAPHDVSTCASRPNDLREAPGELRKGTKKKNKRESYDSPSVSDSAFDLFWNIYPRAESWDGIRKAARQIFHTQVRKLGGDQAAAEVLIKRVTQYAADFEGSNLSPHNPINFLKAEGLLPAPNDRKKSTPLDVENIADRIIVRPSKATLEHRERTKNDPK